ncbi:Plasmodium exported protein (Pm-fam-a like), unknown function [Plasmodium malariae]|uniref:Fam-l protein n=2 Tax=Plasmodium (Plasmodium) TaxID=418103 RepID=A0A1A8X0C4_PLAMA|nr:Plasmodium exported protein (Pm-fam-a like), unknown function [Plasmodium malariae]
MSRFNKILDENYGSDKKLDTRIYRLLGNCVKGIFANVGDLELKISYNKKKNKKQLFTTDNEKWNKENKEKLYRSALIKEKLIKQLMKNKSTMLHKSYNYYEKKIMNGLNDKAFFKKMMLINDKNYKKLKRKKYGLRLFLLLLLFVVVLMIPILDLSLSNSNNSIYLLTLLCQILGYSSTSDSQSLQAGSGGVDTPSLSSFCSKNSTTALKVSSILIYCVPILILAIMLILGIFCYYRKIIKHKQIKSLETFYEW